MSTVKKMIKSHIYVIKHINIYISGKIDIIERFLKTYSRCTSYNGNH